MQNPSSPLISFISNATKNSNNTSTITEITVYDEMVTVMFIIAVLIMAACFLGCAGYVLIKWKRWYDSGCKCTPIPSLIKSLLQCCGLSSNYNALNNSKPNNVQLSENKLPNKQALSIPRDADIFESDESVNHSHIYSIKSETENTVGHDEDEDEDEEVHLESGNNRQKLLKHNLSAKQEDNNDDDDINNNPNNDTNTKNQKRIPSGDTIHEKKHYYHITESKTPHQD